MDDFFAAMTQIEADTERELQELFGDKREEDLSDEEVRTIFADMPHARKLAKLAVIRAGQTVKPVTFAKRMTKAGRIHAAGLGIRLD